MALTFEASRCVLAMLHHLRLFLVSRTTTSFKACALSEVHSTANTKSDDINVVKPYVRPARSAPGDPRIGRRSGSAVSVCLWKSF